MKFKYHIPHTKYKTRSRARGFSLIELIVAVALFAVVMVVAIGALLALVTANRKARALESVMNNLNITLDGMVRSMRMGTYYHCDSTLIPDTSSADGDCAEGGTTFSFAPFGSDEGAQNQRVAYSFQNGQLWRSETGGPDAIAVTAPEVDIQEMTFYVVGTERRDTTQPKVVIVVKGTAGAEKVNTTTTFYIQATAVQRALDI